MLIASHPSWLQAVTVRLISSKSSFLRFYLATVTRDWMVYYIRYTAFAHRIGCLCTRIYMYYIGTTDGWRMCTVYSKQYCVALPRRSAESVS